nr:MAG TPA: hypothetical protein [Caudoviricetes sp.]
MVPFLANCSKRSSLISSLNISFLVFLALRPPLLHARAEKSLLSRAPTGLL